MKRRDAYAAIADPTRRRILELLRDRGPLPAGEIAARFRSAARPGISRHLRVLRESGLVKDRAIGRTRHYRLMPEPLAEIRDGWLASFATMYTDSLSELRRRAEKK